MNTELNRMVVMGVRKDLKGRGEVVYVPWDMTDEELQEKFADKLKAGLVKRINASPSQTITAEEAAAEVAIPRKKIFIQPPPMVQVGVDIADVYPVNAVSQGLGGPTKVIGVHVLMPIVRTSVELCMVGVAVSTSKDVGPFAGDLDLLSSGPLPAGAGYNRGRGVVLQIPYMNTVSGSINEVPYLFPCDQLIPFDQFYINVTVHSIISGGTWLVSVIFAPLEYYEGEKFGLKAIQPRWAHVQTTTYRAPWTPPEVRPTAYVIKAPVPTREVVVKAAPPAKVVVPPIAKVPEKRRFKNYAEIKTLEATGYTIVWATLRNTGEGHWGFPLEVTVVRR